MKENISKALFVVLIVASVFVSPAIALFAGIVLAQLNLSKKRSPKAAENA